MLSEGKARSSILLFFYDLLRLKVSSQNIEKELKGTGSRGRIQIFWQKCIVMGLNKSF